MAFPFIIGHIPGKANAAADFLSRMHMDPNQKIELKIKEPLPMQTIELNISAKLPPICPIQKGGRYEKGENLPDIQEEDEDSEWEFWPEDHYEGFDMKNEIDEGFEDGEEEGIYTIAKFYDLSLAPEINALTEDNPLDTFDLTDSLTQIDWVAEQAQDPTIQKVIEWRHVNQVPFKMYRTAEEEKYAQQFHRLTIRKGVLCREYYDHTGKISHYQTVVPPHKRAEVLYRVHNSKLKTHNGISKTIIEYRKQFYFPGFTEQLVNYIKNCLTCNQIKPIPKSLRTPPLQEMMTEVGLPAEAMQIDIVGKLPDANGYKYILTAIDVFSRYLFAIPLREQSALHTARALVGIFLTHAYVPKTIITDPRIKLHISNDQGAHRRT